MNVTPHVQAVMLLTLSFGKLSQHDSKPLSNKEWSLLAIWLNAHDLDPADLLKGDVGTTLTGWQDRGVTLDRIRGLLDRGAALGLALEKWQRAGLWAVTRSDPDYPQHIKKRLGGASPAVLFGCGDKKHLNSVGLAVVGSRDAGEEDLAFTRRLGGQIAEQGYLLVSGGARGVDETAMLGAMESEGTAVGVLADSLLKSATSSRFRKGIMSGSLALVSPFNPEAGFNVGKAMHRNRYIYCLSDAAIVISSSLDRGGTWNGAVEDLRAGWTPLWVKKVSNQGSGNPELVRLGAKWLPDGPREIKDWLSQRTHVTEQGEPAPAPPTRCEEVQDPHNRVGLPPSPPAPGTTPTDNPEEPPKPMLGVEPDFYSLFIERMEELTREAPMKLEDLASRLDLEVSQLRAWLKRATGERKVSKLTRPVRYQAASTASQRSLSFPDER